MIYIDFIGVCEIGKAFRRALRCHFRTPSWIENCCFACVRIKIIEIWVAGSRCLFWGSKLAPVSLGAAPHPAVKTLRT